MANPNWKTMDSAPKDGAKSLLLFIFPGLLARVVRRGRSDGRDVLGTRRSSIYERCTHDGICDGRTPARPRRLLLRIREQRRVFKPNALGCNDCEHVCSRSGSLVLEFNIAWASLTLNSTIAARLREDHSAGCGARRRSFSTPLTSTAMAAVPITKPSAMTAAKPSTRSKPPLACRTWISQTAAPEARKVTK